LGSKGSTENQRPSVVPDRFLRQCYRNAEGLTWDGQGDLPAWLRRALNAGQSVEFFRAGSAAGYPNVNSRRRYTS